MSKNRNISVSDAVQRIGKSRLDYYRRLPIMTRVKEKSPPYAVPPHFVRTLRNAAKQLRKDISIKLSEALDLVAKHAGFHDWSHVKKMEGEYELTVQKALHSGFVFAIWYPQNLTMPNWNLSILEPFGLVHDPRIIFTAAENLKYCCYDHQAGETPYRVLGTVSGVNECVNDLSAKTEDFINIISADEYKENNLPGLFFFRYIGSKLPADIEGARDFIEHAIGKVRWNPRPKESEIQYVEHELSNNDISVSKVIFPKINDDPSLPPIGDHSDMSRHIPIVHYLWLNGKFLELDSYSYGDLVDSTF